MVPRAVNLRDPILHLAKEKCLTFRADTSISKQLTFIITFALQISAPPFSEVSIN